jgi:hypothetical protein
VQFIKILREFRKGGWGLDLLVSHVGNPHIARSSSATLSS